MLHHERSGTEQNQRQRITQKARRGNTGPGWGPELFKKDHPRVVVREPFLFCIDGRPMKIQLLRFVPESIRGRRR